MSERALQTHLSRRQLIDGKELLVFDDLFAPAEVAEVYKILSHVPYELADVDSEETAYSRHWLAEFELDEVPQMFFFARILAAIEETYGADRYALRRVHANLQLYGDLQFEHHDTRDGLTALYYANAEWKPAWMGETVFYSDAHEPLHVVAPRPGRLVLFHGSLFHRAGVPSRECFEPRITVAFKLAPAAS